MKHVDQENKGQAVVGDDGDEVVYGRDERAGGDGGVDVNFVEKHGNHGTDEAGDDHGDDE